MAEEFELTQEQFDELVSRVIEDIRKNSRTIPELNNVDVLNATDSFEINRGRNVSYAGLKAQLFSIFGNMTEEELAEVFNILRKRDFLYRLQDDTAEGVITFLAGLYIGDFIHRNTGASINFQGDAELNELFVRMDAVFNRNLSSEDFISGFIGGKGWALMKDAVKNALGIEEYKYTLEIDNLIVRGILRVYEMIISQLLGENDNRIFTAMLEVDHYDPETGIVWLDTQDGKFYNPFRKDDYIMVQQYNGMPSEENGYYVTKHYELIITEVGIGNLADKENRLDWVKFKNFTTSMEGLGPKDLITKGDTFVRVDNATDPDRKGIIQVITVGNKTPYIDVIYGLKTDPDDYLKVRMGNLQGIRHHLFGWLEGYGLYSNNCYLVGDFRLARTGESVDAQIQMLKDKFSSQYSQITYDITEDDNLLYNPTFTENMEGWRVIQDTASFVLEDDMNMLMNGNVFLNDSTGGNGAHIATLDNYESRQMLHILNCGVSQANSVIRQKMEATGKTLTHTEYTPGKESGTITDTTDKDGKVVKAETTLAETKTEVPNKLYLSIRFTALSSGTLRIGFKGSDGKARFGTYDTDAIAIDRSSEWQIREWEGTWDGSGDFVLEYTGEIYVSQLGLTDDPLGSYKNEMGTLIEQTTSNIKLVAWNTSQNSKSVASLEIWSDRIRAQVWDENGRSRFDITSERIEGVVTDLKNFKEQDFANLRQTVSGLNTQVTNLNTNFGNLNSYIQTIKDALVDNNGKPITWSEFVQTTNNINASVNKIEGDLYPADGNGWVALKQGFLSITTDFTKLGSVLVKQDNLSTLVKQAGFMSTSDAASLYAAEKYLNDYKKDIESISQIQVTVNGFSATYVKNGQTIADINASAAGLKISATKISLKGYTEINNFIIDTVGNVTVNGDLTASFFANRINTAINGTINGSIITNQSPSGTAVLPTLKSGVAILVRVMLPYIRRANPTGSSLDELYMPATFDLHLLTGQNARFLLPTRVTTNTSNTYLHLPRYGGCYLDLIGVSGALDGGDVWYVIPHAADSGRFVINNTSTV